LVKKTFEINFSNFPRQRFNTTEMSLLILTRQTEILFKKEENVFPELFDKN